MSRAWTLVATALVACKPRPTPQVVAEFEKRSHYVRGLSDDERWPAGWSLNSRPDLSFEDGMSLPTFVDEEAIDASLWSAYRTPPDVKVALIRWLNRTVHFRARGDADMAFAIRGRVNVRQVFTTPRLELFIGGQLVASHLIGESGRFEVRVVVPRPIDWIDLYVVFASAIELERAPADPYVARLEHVEWAAVR